MISGNLFHIPFVWLLVNETREYVPTKNPGPDPTNISIIINIDDILDVNENKKQITLLLRITFEWFDMKLDVKRSKEETET